MNRPATILMVEDDRMDIELTLDAFREARLDNPVHVVQTGEAALDYLFGRGEYGDRTRYPLPDLILLDLKLPGISGHEALQRIKTEPGLKRIPVIILTSSEQEADLQRSYDNGANSYLLKPVAFEGFIGVVRTLGEYWLSLNVRPPLDDRPDPPEVFP